MRDRPLHIGYVLREFPRLSETFILNEILELERQGARITIFAVRKPVGEAVHPAVAMVRAPIVHLKDHEPGCWWRALSGNSPIASGRVPRLALLTLSRSGPGAAKQALRGAAIAARAMEDGIDVFHAHYATGPSALAQYASLLSGIPFSFTAHAYDIFLDSTDQNALREKLNAARFAITVTQFNHRYLVDRFGSDIRGKVRVIHNGIDLACFSPASRQPSQENLILGVGRLVPKKGFGDLLRACAELKSRGVAYRCCVVGDGPEKPALDKLTSDLGIGSSVRFAGPMTQDQVRELLQTATVMCLPCRRDAHGNQDALPTVLLEALAVGLPVVSTELSGIPEIVTSGTDGFLVPPDNPEALAAALEQILAAPAIRQRLAAEGRRKAERMFDLRKNVAKLHGLFRESAGISTTTPAGEESAWES